VDGVVGVYGYELVAGNRHSLRAGSSVRPKQLAQIHTVIRADNRCGLSNTTARESGGKRMLLPFPVQRDAIIRRFKSDPAHSFNTQRAKDYHVTLGQGVT